MKKAAIFDMDGTLCDVSTIRHHVRHHPKRFDLFHQDSVNCPPHSWVAGMARRYYMTGWAVLIVTARKRKYEPWTAWWLALNNVPSTELYMRPDTSFAKDYVVKKDLLAQIRADGYDPQVAYDDNPNVIKLWKEEGIRTVVVPGWEDTTPSYTWYSPNPVVTSVSEKPGAEQIVDDWEWFDSQFAYYG